MSWARCFDINVAGTFRTCRVVILAMRKQKQGRIVNAASFVAIIPQVNAAECGASKVAVVQFTRVLAGGFGPWNFTANSYAPEIVPTAMNGFSDLSAADRDRLQDLLTIRRWGEPEDISNAVKFLASDDASYITRTLLDVSGGKLATQMPNRAYEGYGPSWGADADPVDL